MNTKNTFLGVTLSFVLLIIFTMPALAATYQKIDAKYFKSPFGVPVNATANFVYETGYPSGGQTNWVVVQSGTPNNWNVKILNPVNQTTPNYRVKFSYEMWFTGTAKTTNTFYIVTSGLY